MSVNVTTDACVGGKCNGHGKCHNYLNGHVLFSTCKCYSGKINPKWITHRYRGELCLSGRVLEVRLRGCGFETNRRHCIVSLSMTFFPLFNTGSTREISRHDWKIVDLDIKHQHKQTEQAMNREGQFIAVTAILGAQWLSGRVLDSRPKGWGLSLSSVTALCPWARHINPCLALVQPRNSRPDITERLLTWSWDVKNQIKQQAFSLIFQQNYPLTSFNSLMFGNISQFFVVYWFFPKSTFQ